MNVRFGVLEKIASIPRESAAGRRHLAVIMKDRSGANRISVVQRNRSFDGVLQFATMMAMIPIKHFFGRCQMLTPCMPQDYVRHFA
jgi:hypothetical protein